MQILPLRITKKGYTYTQLERTGNKAIYSQHDADGNLVGHEVFKIIVAKESEAFGIVFPERECYPTDLAFGVTAWSVGCDLERATQKYRELEVKIKDVELC